MRFGFARLIAGLLGVTALSALRPADLGAAGSRVAIISPKSGSTVSGTITVSLQATGEPQPDYLIIGIDEHRPCSTNCQPYRIDLDTTQYPDGVHFLWAEAHARGTLIAVSSRVKVFLANGNRPTPEPAARPPADTAPLVESKPSAVPIAEPTPAASAPAVWAMPRSAPGHLVESKPTQSPRALSVVIMGRRVQSDVEPRMNQGRVLVGFRAVLEGLGATVHWQADKRLASALRQGLRIEVTIGSKIARVDGKEVLLHTAAHIRRDRTIVPFRFCADSLGYQVAWRSASRRAELYAAELSAEAH